MAEKSWLVIAARFLAGEKKARIEVQWRADILKQQLVLKLPKHAFSYQDTTYLIASSIKADTGLWRGPGVLLLPAFTAPKCEKRCRFRARGRAISRGGRGFCLGSLIPRMDEQTQNRFRIASIKGDVSAFARQAEPQEATVSISAWTLSGFGMRRRHSFQAPNAVALAPCATTFKR